MPDIAMCQNTKCPKRLTCYRFMAKPCGYQSYAAFEAEGCEYYWPIVKEKKEKKV